MSSAACLVLPGTQPKAGPCRCGISYINAISAISMLYQWWNINAISTLFHLVSVFFHAETGATNSIGQCGVDMVVLETKRYHIHGVCVKDGYLPVIICNFPQLKHFKTWSFVKIVLLVRGYPHGWHHQTATVRNSIGGWCWLSPLSVSINSVLFISEITTVLIWSLCFLFANVCISIVSASWSCTWCLLDFFCWWYAWFKIESNWSIENPFGFQEIAHLIYCNLEAQLIVELVKISTVIITYDGSNYLDS